MNNQKQTCVISCPIDTFSGYGSRARDFVKSTIEAKGEEWDIHIMPQRWGNTPWGYISAHQEEWGFLEKHIMPVGAQLQQKPDIWMQISIPNEFQPIGGYNIGVTAGIETTLCHPSWIEGLNRMDLNLVSSNHAKKVFHDTKAQYKDQAGNVTKEISIQKPIEVIFEGVDLNTYFKMEDDEIPECDVINSLDEIEESFAYLFVGHWLQGAVGEDRKNIGQMIKVFLETFKNQHNAPALVLKTAIHNGSIMDHTDTLKKINSIKDTVKAKTLPNIYLIHGELDEEEINFIYNHPKIKAMINITKGEGFGRPLLEFSVTGKPMIVSGWSGHIDFLKPEFVSLLPGELRQVHQSAVVKDIIVPESAWFNADLAELGKRMKEVKANYKKELKRSVRQGHHSKTNFSFDKMTEKLKSYYDEYVKETPKLVLPTLPKLNKIG